MYLDNQYCKCSTRSVVSASFSVANALPPLIIKPPNLMPYLALGKSCTAQLGPSPSAPHRISLCYKMEDPLLVVVEEEDVLLTVNWDSCAARCKFHMNDDQWNELQKARLMQLVSLRMNVMMNAMVMNTNPSLIILPSHYVDIDSNTIKYI